MVEIPHDEQQAETVLFTAPSAMRVGSGLLGAHIIVEPGEDAHPSLLAQERLAEIERRILAIEAKINV